MTDPIKLKCIFFILMFTVQLSFHGFSQTKEEKSQIKAGVKRYIKNMSATTTGYLPISFTNYEVTKKGYLVKHSFKQKGSNPSTPQLSTFLYELNKGFVVFATWTQKGYNENLEREATMIEFLQDFKEAEQYLNNYFGLGEINLLGKTRDEIEKVTVNYTVDNSKEPTLFLKSGDRELNYHFNDEGKCTLMTYIFGYPNDGNLSKYMLESLPFDKREKGGFEFSIQNYYGQIFWNPQHTYEGHVLGK